MENDIIQKGMSGTRRNYLMGFLAAFLVIGSFFVGLNVDKLQSAEAVAQCEGRLVGVGDKPPIVLEDVNFDTFWEVWNDLKINHVSQSASDLEMYYGAIRGMVASLGDQHTHYFDPSEAKMFFDDMSGSFDGIGAEIGVKDGVLKVVAPLPGTPADRAGLMTGDSILAIDGNDTAGITVDKAVFNIRGKKGTPVTLLISREGWEESRDFRIIRDTIVIESVKWKTVESDGKKIGVISISSFLEDTEAKFKQAVHEVLLSDPDGIVIDLRNNPGGLLDSSVMISSEWIDNDLVVRERVGADGTVIDYVSEGKARLDGYRTVVLVNGGSASASEIMSGALQDYGKAILVGEKTYGKGSVQSYATYDDESALKVTISLWYTPKDRSIDKNGIEPDITVKADPEWRPGKDGNDVQMDKALELLVTDSWPPAPDSGSEEVK